MRPMPWFRALFVLAVLPAFAATVRAKDQPSGIAADAMRLDGQAAQVDDAARVADWPTARQAWSGFDELWDSVEDGVRAFSRDAYRSIEDDMARVGTALRASEPDIPLVRAELGALRGHVQLLIPTSVPAASSPAGATPRPTAPAMAPPAPGGLQPNLSLLSLAPTPRALEPSPTSVPESCTTPSISVTPASLRSDGVLDWRARGFKPGTTVRVVVQGPTAAGSISGPVVRRFESMPVDRSCSARGNDEGIPAEGLLEDNPNLPSGHYVLVVSGIRWNGGNVTESEMRLFAPFNFYYQSVFRQ